MRFEVRAAIAPDVGQPLVIETVALRDPADDELVIGMKASGLCHTDLSIMEGKFPMPLPAVLGHEGAGVVLHAGPAVKRLKVGDHVILNNTPHCGVCDPCHAPYTSYCDQMAPGRERPSPFLWNGEPLATMLNVASFATHTILPEDRLTRIDPTVAFDAAALVPCGVMTGVGAVMNVAKVRRDSHVVVFGMGSIGLNVVQAARLAGAATVIAVDLNPSKEAMARQFGATHFINPVDSEVPIGKRVSTLIGGLADFAFECVGNTKLVEQAVRLVNPYWGVAVAVGIAGFDQVIQLPATSFYFGRTLRGTFIGDGDPHRDTAQIVDWYRQGDIQLDPLVTHHLTLDEINQGFELMKTGQSIRSVILY